MNTKTHKFLSLLPPLCIFLTVFSFFLSAEAQEPIPAIATSTEEASQRRTMIEERSQNREALATERQASTSERIKERQNIHTNRQAALEEVRQKRVLNLGANISNRMEAAIARLYDIIGRFEQRIEKLKITGIDTAIAETKVREASQALAEARAALSTIDTLVYNATTSTEPQSNWAAVRTTYQEAGQHIRTCHQALREAVSLLKTATTSTTPAESTITASTTE